MNDVVIVKLAETRNEWEEVAKLIDEKYGKEYGIVPPPAREHFIALMNGEIIATLGVEFCNPKGELPLEKYLEILDEEFKRLPKRELVEFTRWVSRYPFGGRMVGFGAEEYALCQGKRYVIVSVKEKQLQSMIAYRAKFSVLSTAIKENPPKDFFGYYCMPPYPIVVLAEIKSWRDNVERVITKLRKQGMKINFEF